MVNVTEAFLPQGALYHTRWWLVRQEQLRILNLVPKCSFVTYRSGNLPHNCPDLYRIHKASTTLFLLEGDTPGIESCLLYVKHELQPMKLSLQPVLLSFLKILRIRPRASCVQGTNFTTESHLGLHCVLGLHELSRVPTLTRVVFSSRVSSYLSPSLCLVPAFQSLVIIFLSFPKLCLGDLRAGGTGCLSSINTIAERWWIGWQGVHGAGSQVLLAAPFQFALSGVPGSGQVSVPHVLPLSHYGSETGWFLKVPANAPALWFVGSWKVECTFFWFNKWK